MILLLLFILKLNNINKLSKYFPKNLSAVMKLKIIAMVVYLIVFVFGSNLFAQGLNNNFPFDSIDIQQAFSILGLDVYKFPLKKQTENCKLKIVLAVYINHEKRKEINITQNMPDEYLMLNENDRTIRLYFQKLEDNKLKFFFKLDNYHLPVIVDLNKSNENTSKVNFALIDPYPKVIDIKLSGTRAFSYFQPEKGKSTPAFIWYAIDQKNEVNSMHCPGINTEESAAQIYDYIVVAKFEIEDVQ